MITGDWITVPPFTACLKRTSDCLCVKLLFGVHLVQTCILSQEILMSCTSLLIWANYCKSRGMQLFGRRFIFVFVDMKKRVTEPQWGVFRMRHDVGHLNFRIIQIRQFHLAWLSSAKDGTSLPALESPCGTPVSAATHEHAVHGSSSLCRALSTPQLHVQLESIQLFLEAKKRC